MRAGASIMREAAAKRKAVRREPPRLLERAPDDNYEELCDRRAVARESPRDAARFSSSKEKAMPVTLIAKIKAKQGSEQQLEDAFHDMIKKVRAAEPGCQTYILHKSNQDPTTFVWFETYADQAAFDNHRKTDHMKEMGQRIANLLDGRPQIEMLTELDRK
jgi:quinol monooxygenase YgiN